MKFFPQVVLILSLCCIYIRVYGQSHFPTESETHIFWQQDRKLQVSDYQGGDSNDTIYNRNRELGSPVIPCLGIFLKIDIPRNYRKNKLEKVYFAPAFQKSCSYLLDNDTSNFRDGQIQFDIYELATRIARNLIWNTHASMAIETDSTLIEVINSNPDTILITGLA